MKRLEDKHVVEEPKTPSLMDADKTSNNDVLLRVVMDDFNKARDYIKDNYQGVWMNALRPTTVFALDEDIRALQTSLFLRLSLS